MRFRISNEKNFSQEFEASAPEEFEPAFMEAAKAYRRCPNNYRRYHRGEIRQDWIIFHEGHLHVFDNQERWVDFGFQRETRGIQFLEHADFKIPIVSFKSSENAFEEIDEKDKIFIEGCASLYWQCALASVGFSDNLNLGIMQLGDFLDKQIDQT